jgi:DNA-directed RNA polymerase subunit RPC12/RpoP
MNKLYKEYTWLREGNVSRLKSLWIVMKMAFDYYRFNTCTHDLEKENTEPFSYYCVKCKHRVFPKKVFKRYKQEHGIK